MRHLEQATYVRIPLFMAICQIFILGTCSDIYGGSPDFVIKRGASATCRTQINLPPAETLAAPDALKILPPPDGAYAGVYSIETTQEDYHKSARRNGEYPPLVYTFHDWLWDKDLTRRNPELRTLESEMEEKGISPVQLARNLNRNGTVLALGWAIQCCDWSSKDWWYGETQVHVTIAKLLDGQYDSYVKRVAAQVKSLEIPVMLSLFTEFNWQGAFAFGRDGLTKITEVDDICGQYGDDGWPDGPERVRDAYRHVIDIFRKEGVKNVTWFMYANSGYMDPDRDDYSQWLHPKYFYPGDEYIDWVGQSAYFIDPEWGDEVTEDASEITSALVAGYEAWGEVTQRPLFLPEFGAVGNSRTDRSRILTKVLRDVIPTMPRIKALTLADFYIAEVCCDVPRLGKFYQQETQSWKQSVSDNSYYVDTIRIGPPENNNPFPTWINLLF